MKEEEKWEMKKGTAHMWNKQKRNRREGVCERERDALTRPLETIHTSLRITSHTTYCCTHKKVLIMRENIPPFYPSLPPPFLLPHARSRTNLGKRTKYCMIVFALKNVYRRKRLIVLIPTFVLVCSLCVLLCSPTRTIHDQRQRVA